MHALLLHSQAVALLEQLLRVQQEGAFLVTQIQEQSYKQDKGLL
jgi:hypothetical protein